MHQKKRIVFYPMLATGHVNVVTSLAKILLNQFSNEIEIYFITDKLWKSKLELKDSKFKFSVFEYAGYDELRIKNNLEQLEKFMEIPLINRYIIDKLKLNLQFLNIFKLFFRLVNSIDVFINDSTEEEMDIKIEKLIKELNPDIVLCDHFWVLPSLLTSKVNYGFIGSSNPSVFLLDDYPLFGSDAGVNDKLKIEEFKNAYEECRKRRVAHLNERYKERGAKLTTKKYPVDAPLSEFFPTIYTYPKELDYFSEETKKQFNLWRIDSALLKASIPTKFELPIDFAALSGEIVYVSLGTCFSVYTDRFQKLINTLDRLPFKYIVSKGAEGDKIRFPSTKFIGNNHVNQLAVLQTCSVMISHGGLYFI